MSYAYIFMSIQIHTHILLLYIGRYFKLPSTLLMNEWCLGGRSFISRGIVKMGGRPQHLDSSWNNNYMLILETSFFIIKIWFTIRRLNNKAKQPESGDQCCNITEFGVAEGDPSATPNKVILPYSTPDEGCYVFISYCLMVLKSFQAKIYELNMHLLHFIFLNQCRNTSHCNTKVTWPTL